MPQNDSYAVYYLTEIDPRVVMGCAVRRSRASACSAVVSRRSITRRATWCGGDLGGNMVAYDPANGKPLWHSHIGQVSNAPETYLLDGRQYLLVASGDALFTFALRQ